MSSRVLSSNRNSNQAKYLISESSENFFKSEVVGCPNFSFYYDEIYPIREDVRTDVIEYTFNIDYREELCDFELVIDLPLGSDLVDKILDMHTLFSFIKNIRFEIGGGIINEISGYNLIAYFMIRGERVSINRHVNHNTNTKYKRFMFKLPVGVEEPFPIYSLKYHEIRIKISIYNDITGVSINPDRIYLNNRYYTLTESYLDKINKPKIDLLFEIYSSQTFECCESKKLELTGPIKYLVVIVHRYCYNPSFYNSDPIESITIHQTNSKTNKLVDSCCTRMRIHDPYNLVGREFPFGMYLVPFCLKPNSNNPSGFINTSNMPLTIKINYTFDISTSGLKTTVCGCGYRTHTIYNGMINHLW